ncbi:hypothetical protein LB504_003837, partial [Fusarium proliferatum]
MATSVPKDDTKISGHSDLAPTTSYIDGEVLDAGTDYGYLNASKFPKFYRSVLFQMILLGLLSCVGPAMSDAISNLGGGGLSTPYLANLATSLNYTAGCLLTLFGGPLINKFGIKWSCIIAAVGMPLSGSAYYVCAKYRVNWYLIFAKILTGFTYGFLYVAESTAILSYPLANDRGFYLGVWSAMRNSGSVIGGAINFSNNHSDSKAGGVAWSTYLVFIAFECTGLIWAFLLSPTRRVRRHDGTKVAISESASWKQEFAALWKHLQRQKVDLAHGTACLLLVLLWRNDGHLSIVALFSSSESTVFSPPPNTFYRRGNPLWKASRQNSLVPDQASTDFFRLLVDSTGSLLHLDWNRVCQVWWQQTQKRSGLSNQHQRMGESLPPVFDNAINKLRMPAPPMPDLLPVRV